jgi:hypothetical protein
MDQAIALANNDVVLLAWSYEAKIADCLGFAIYRLDSDGQRNPLPAWVGFHGEDNPDWDPSTTEHWPVQKFSWRDLTASRGQMYSYEIVPMAGSPGDLAPLEDRALTTNPVTLTPVRSENVRAYFNRGILSTQALAHKLPHDGDGGPSSEALLEHIRTPGDEIRMSLAGQIIEALSLLAKRADEENGSVHAALYELNDPELVDLLLDPDHVSLVLSNAGEGERRDSTNEDARQKIHDDHVDVTDRMLGGGHIGHDKFTVYVTEAGNPRTVQTGSTNWTSTGLCAQANNAIVLTSEALAGAYLDFWSRLKAECSADSAEDATQSPALRSTNQERTAHSIADPWTIDGARVSLCLSPNTPQQGKPSTDPPRPVDMGELFELIAAARKGILFLLFQPGSPSVLDAILEAQVANHELFVRGAATDPEAIENYDTTLFHRTGDHPEVAAAAELDHAFGYWQKELLKSSPSAHAVIHDKIVIIDPTSDDDCLVVTGSHNLGYTASYANDENLLIIKGHRSLAEAYATHVMDIYDHYRWRWRQQHPDPGDPAPAGDDVGFGLATEEGWQSKYFEDPEAVAERLFWLGGAGG